MKNLSKAIYSKLSGSDLADHIGTRLYKGRAHDPTYPYVVYIIVSNYPDRTFTSVYENVDIQFSIFSNASSSTEVEDIYTDLTALYDECSMSITGETLIWMRRLNASLMVEDHTTLSGTTKVWHYAVDFTVTVI